MTVHGAKGLQAPLVVFRTRRACRPRTGRSPGPPTRPPGPKSRSGPPGRRWAAPRPTACAPTSATAMEEYNRLLYVALTRAEDRLVVCGWQTASRCRTRAGTAWSRAASLGSRRPPSIRAIGTGRAGAQLPADRTHPRQPAGRTILTRRPAVLGRTARRLAPRPAASRTRRSPSPLAPSRPDDVLLGPVPRAASPLAQAGRAGRSCAGGSSTSCCSTCRRWRRSAGSGARLAHLARPRARAAEAGCSPARCSACSATPN